MTNKMVSAALAVLALAAPVQRVAAAGFTATVIDTEGRAQLWGKGVGDLNGDGQDELLVGSRTGGLDYYQYEVPGWSKHTISATTRIEEDMQVVDLDKDNRMDVVAVTNQSLTWFRKNEVGGWTETPLVTGINSHDVEVLDLDGDGKLDLAARNQGKTGNVLYIWRQVAINSWAQSTIALPTTGEGLASADIDRNGRPDLVIGEYWYRNMSSPGRIWLWRTRYGQAAPKDAYIAIGDLNDDGRLDIVASPAEPNDQFHPFLWFEAPLDPTQAWTTHTLEASVEKVQHFTGVTDFDLDGDLDVVAALTHQANQKQIKLYVNTDGAGTFAPPQAIANLSSHSMKFVTVGADRGQSIFGADYAEYTKTPVRLFRWKAD